MRFDFILHTEIPIESINLILFAPFAQYKFHFNKKKLIFIYQYLRTINHIKFAPLSLTASSFVSLFIWLQMDIHMNLRIKSGYANHEMNAFVNWKLE